MMLNKEDVAKVNLYGPEDLEITSSSLMEWISQARKQSAVQHLEGARALKQARGMRIRKQG